ncbi:glycosyltransferase family 9 protein [Pollutibacter soli]|uniref:glycosyltransferase family 9 protein n=1 Tax=Pollutibacter soli TaxID=3034157 RepID=UPI0030132099
MKQFLIIQTAFIGDVILATALIEKLHSYYPDASIDFLLRKGNEGILAGHPYVRELMIWEKKKDKFKNLFRLLSKIRSKRYDAVINVQRFAATGMLTTFSRAKTKIGFDKNPWNHFFDIRVPHIVSTSDRPIHEVDRNQALIESFTDKIYARPRMYPSANDFEKVSKYKRQPFICIAPASVWFTKQYPAGQWASFIDSIPNPPEIFLIGAPNDKILAEEIIEASGRKGRIFNLCGQLSFLESAALMKDAEMNYVNDSAPMHIASAMNAPVAAVYCSTVPSFGFGPLSDKKFIIEIEKKLDCRPCGLHGHKVCPLGHFHCATGIRDEQLVEVLTGSVQQASGNRPNQ